MFSTHHVLAAIHHFVEIDFVAKKEFKKTLVDKNTNKKAENEIEKQKKKCL